MATTAKATTDTPGRTRRSARTPVARGVALLATAGFVAPVLAERWRLEPGIESQVTATSNSNFGGSELTRSDAERDTVIEVRPRLAFRGEGARFRINGSVGLNGVAYADRTQDSKVLPSADVTSRLEAVERFFFVEAGYRATQTSSDPFAVRPIDGSTVNTVTTTEARLSPYIEGTMRGDVRYSLRADNSWVREIGAPDGASTTAGYFGRYRAAMQKVPRPFGWRVEAERTFTRYEAEAEPSVGLTQARVFADYALTPEFMVAIRGGRESNDLAGGVESRSFSGFEFNWEPSPRTTLNAYRENRFFGPAWQLNFNHRMPRVAWTAVVSRNLDTAPQSLFELPATGNVASLLDSMYTTRYPDPVERARVVQDLMARNGLPASTRGPLSLLTDRVSIVTRREANIAFNGVRNTVKLTAYRVETVDVQDESSLSTGSSDENNRQYGASFLINHRLSQLITLNFTVDWNRIRSIGVTPADETTQRSADLRVNTQLTPRTNVFLGGRYRKIASNVVVAGQEKAVFLGLDHRF